MVTWQYLPIRTVWISLLGTWIRSWGITLAGMFFLTYSIAYRTSTHNKLNYGYLRSEKFDGINRTNLFNKIKRLNLLIILRLQGVPKNALLSLKACKSGFLNHLLGQRHIWKYQTLSCTGMFEKSGLEESYLNTKLDNIRKKTCDQ